MLEDRDSAIQVAREEDKRLKSTKIEVLVLKLSCQNFSKGPLTEWERIWD